MARFIDRLSGSPGGKSSVKTSKNSRNSCFALIRCCRWHWKSCLPGSWRRELLRNFPNAFFLTQQRSIFVYLHVGDVDVSGVGFVECQTYLIYTYLFWETVGVITGLSCYGVPSKLLYWQFASIQMDRYWWCSIWLSTLRTASDAFSTWFFPEWRTTVFFCLILKRCRFYWEISGM